MRLHATFVQCGSVAEWYKALVSGTSHFYDVGLKPTTSSHWNFGLKNKM